MKFKHGIFCILLWPKDFAAEIINVLFFLSSDSGCSGTQGLAAAKQRETVLTELRRPLFLVFIIVTKLAPLSLQWQL